MKKPLSILTLPLVIGFWLLGFTPTSAVFFSDVTTSHVNFEAIIYAQSQGIIQGYADGSFKPDQTINRAEFLKIVMGAVSDQEIPEANEACFADVDHGAWFEKYICFAKDQGIISGYSDNTFKPIREIEFVEAAKIIVNAFGTSPTPDERVWFHPFVTELEKGKAIPTTINDFGKKITRGEMIEIIFRLDAEVTDKPSLTYAQLAGETVVTNPPAPSVPTNPSNPSNPSPATTPPAAENPPAQTTPPPSNPSPSTPIVETPSNVIPDFFACDCGSGADSQCQPGDDSNNGTSPETPWKSHEKVRSYFNSTLPAGKTIGLCRGGVFQTGSDTRWVNNRCLASQPCTVQDYTAPWASGDEGKPVITAADFGFKFENGGNANHEEGYVIRNLELRGSGNNAGVFFYNDIDDVILDQLKITGFALGVHSASSNPANAGSDARNDRLTLKNSIIMNNTAQGWLGSCSDCLIEKNYFEGNGTRPILDHNIYYSSAQSSSNTIIRNNELFRSAFTDGKCRAVSLVSHGNHSNLLIENNIVREEPGKADGGCWGISADSSSSPAEYTNLTIRNNKVINVGNMAIGCGGCEDAVIEGNDIYQEQSTFSFYGISVPSKSEDSATRATVRNNNIWIKNGDEKGGTGITVGKFGTGHQITGNKIVHSDGGGFVCLSLDLPLSSYSTIDNNTCFTSEGESTNWVKDQSGEKTLVEWKSSSSFDLNSKIENPGFTMPTAPNYSMK